MKPKIDLHQTIYDHGGSRIWIETPGGRELVADTYTDAEYAKAIREFTEEWLGTKNKNPDSIPRDETGDIVNLKWEAVSEIRPDGIIISSDEAGCICELVLKGEK